jgi:hypothetical protein
VEVGDLLLRESGGRDQRRRKGRAQERQSA